MTTTTITDDTDLFAVLPERIASALRQSIRSIRTWGQLKAASHRDVLIAKNCGWVTLRQIQDALKQRGLIWPGYDIPYPKQSGPGHPSAIKQSVSGYVYLAQTATHSLTKIGFSAIPEMREKTLQGEDPFFKLVCSIQATAAFELWLHRRFGSVRVRGEWFALACAEIEWISGGSAFANFVTEEATPIDGEFSGLLTPKRLADALGRHRNYVDAMKRCGFQMPGGLATLAEARAWLARNPRPRSRRRLPTAA